MLFRSLPRPLLATPRRCPEAPVPSPSLAALSPLPWLSPSSSTERNRRRRPALARPQPPPCSPGASESSASFPSSSSPSHMVPEAPGCHQHRGSSLSIQELLGVPDLALALPALAVSQYAEPLSSRDLFPSLAAVPIEPESSAPPAMSPPRPELDPAVTLHRIMLLAPQEAV